MAGTTFRSVQVSDPGADLKVVDREERELAPGQVRIAVEACGICHTDSEFVAGYLPGLVFPVTPGHEIAGRIEAVGTRSGAKTVHGHPGGTAMDVEDTLNFAALHRIRPTVEELPLESAAEGYERMLANQARSRVVLTTGRRDRLGTNPTARCSPASPEAGYLATPPESSSPSTPRPPRPPPGAPATKEHSDNDNADRPSGRTYRTLNPATGELLTEYPTATDDEAEALLAREVTGRRPGRWLMSIVFLLVSGQWYTSVNAAGCGPAQCFRGGPQHGFQTKVSSA
jgi:hypothetical protein